jgi:lysyl-tRNA synthetase class 2
MTEESELIKKRKEKMTSLQEDGIDLYPNDVHITDTTQSIHNRFDHMDGESLESSKDRVAIAGRLMAIRNFGKASFVSIQDRKGRIQGYIGKQLIGDDTYRLFKRLDIGDIIGIAGRVFRTKTGELTIEAAEVRLLSKAIQPLPEKWHGLTDIEARYRQRHLDLITNPDVRNVFIKRSVIIGLIRKFMEARDFLEVETPMMQPKAGGATARPFKTHHNALDIDLYLRIAPELYLKRLITGGLERVFEINRNFRNEGISTFHNPEFTMMEFYQAYATYEDLMDMTEEMFISIAEKLFGMPKFTYQERDINLQAPWERISVKDAVIKYGNIAPDILEDGAKAAACAQGLGLAADASDPLGKTIMLLFDSQVEKMLIQPTFVTQYPVEVSPLARRNPANPAFTDRFELYIAGKEIANAFSELNDPMDQRERFVMQLKEREAGDDEAHDMDEDYLSVLEYAMPPTAGEGIGIDRLVMLFTDSASIRDVILFPQMRIREESH